MYKIEIYDTGNYFYSEYETFDSAEKEVKKLYNLKEEEYKDNTYCTLIKEGDGFSVVGKYNHVWYSARVI